MQHILEHLVQTYRPLALICYGSFARGDNDADSDFDALLITDGGERAHDTSIVHSTQLDVFLYPAQELSALDAGEYAQIYDSLLVLDTDGIGADFMRKAAAYWDAQPKKTREEVADELIWLRKMAVRAQRGDTEGYFRLHWLLVDSLEIACDALGQTYFGPKKSLKWLQSHHPTLCAAYEAALRTSDSAAITSWLDALDAACHTRFRA